MELAPVCRSFCRYAAVVFVGITAYTLVTKSPDGRLAGDWFHSLLHIGSAALAAHAGWGTRRSAPAVLFTVLLGAAYLGLGVFAGSSMGSSWARRWPSHSARRTTSSTYWSAAQAPPSSPARSGRAVAREREKGPTGRPRERRVPCARRRRRAASSGPGRPG